MIFIQTVIFINICMSSNIFSYNMDFVWWVLLETPTELLLNVYSPLYLCPSKDPVHCLIHLLWLY